MDKIWFSHVAILWNMPNSFYNFWDILVIPGNLSSYILILTTIVHLIQHLNLPTIDNLDSEIYNWKVDQSIEWVGMEYNSPSRKYTSHV